MTCVAALTVILGAAHAQPQDGLHGAFDVRITTVSVDHSVQADLWLEALDPLAKSRARQLLRQRHDTLEGWRSLLSDRLLSGELSPELHARLQAEDARALAEQQALRQELIRLAAPVREHPSAAPVDRVVWWDDLVVEPGDRVRHAVAIGGDVVVLGEVDRHVGAFAGNVRVVRGGVVRGRPVAMAGSVEGVPPPAPPPAMWKAAIVSGLGFLGVGAAAAWWRPLALRSVADEVMARPFATLAVGLLSVSGSSVMALVLAGLGLGVFPVVATAAALAGCALVGTVGLLVALGDVMLSPRPRIQTAAGLTTALLGTGALMALPALGRTAVLVAAALAVGAVVRVLVRTEA